MHPFDHCAVCVCKLLKSVRDQGKKKTAAASSEEEQRPVFFLCYDVMLGWLWKNRFMSIYNKKPFFYEKWCNLGNFDVCKLNCWKPEKIWPVLDSMYCFSEKANCQMKFQEEMFFMT